VSETPSKAVLRLQSSIKQLQILKGSATAGELAQSFALDIETHELALAEIASLRAQLDEARKALSDIAGASWGQASNGQPMTHKRLTIDRAEQALRALLSESKS